jgi:hypothetical protein
MTELFNRGELRDYLSSRVQSYLNSLEAMHENEMLSRSTDDIVLNLVDAAQIEPITIGAEAIDGGVTEAQVDRYDAFDRTRYTSAGLKIHAVFEYFGNADLLYYRPSTRLMTTFNADVGSGTITVQIEQLGSTPDPVGTKQAIDREIGIIRTMAGHAAADVHGFNSNLDSQFRQAVDRRKKFLQDRRDLAGALGFPLKKRSDAPAPVPMQRKAMGVQRSKPAVQRPTYRDEPALTEAQYEDDAFHGTHAVSGFGKK